LPTEADPLEKHAGLGQAAPQAGELLDAVGGLGNCADGFLRQRGFDRFAVLCQIADRPNDVPAAQPVESAIAVGGQVALHGGSSHSRDLARLGTPESAMHRPQNEHLPPDVQVRMRVAFGGDYFLLCWRQLDGNARHLCPSAMMSPLPSTAELPILTSIEESSCEEMPHSRPCGV